jgi:hypothetical protein
MLIFAWLDVAVLSSDNPALTALLGAACMLAVAITRLANSHQFRDSFSIKATDWFLCVNSKRAWPNCQTGQDCHSGFILVAANCHDILENAGAA